MNFAPRRMRLAAILAPLLVAGCVVGPNFKRPAAPDTTTYTEHPLATTAATPGVAGGDAQRFISEGDLPGDWWTLFHSRALNDLIEAALANNHDLKAAQAALLVAREARLAQRGTKYPQVTAGFTATRVQDPPGALAPVPSNNSFLYNLFTPQVSVSYVPDVFGLNKRTSEQLAAQEQAARYQMIAAQITLSTNVAAAAIEDASIEDQIATTNDLIAIDRHIVDILQYQFTKGYASKLDLAAQQAQLAQTIATLPPLMKQLDQQHNLLSVLAGRYPGQTPGAKFDLAALTLPQDLPVSLPATLVAQRPDVLQAEANLHAASAQVGIATANRLPNVTLTANAGRTALTIGQIFGPGTGFWNIGGALLAPIFDGGTLLHQLRGARAAYTQSAEQYRSAVLTALQNVGDTLTALEQDADALKATSAATDAAKLTLDLSQRQTSSGYASPLALLNAQQAYQTSRLALIQAEAARFADTVALFQALGGGWWHRAELNTESHAG